jgi:methyl-accepting chemotaxis protein
MKTTTIGHKLFGGVATFVVLLLALGGAGVWTANTIHRRLDETGNGTARRILLAATVKTENFRMFGGEKIMIVAAFDNDPALLRQWQGRVSAAHADLTAAIGQLRGLMRVESGKRAVAELADGVERWMAVHRQVEALVLAGQPHEAQQLSLQQGKPLMDANEAAAEVIARNQERFLVSDMETAEAAYARSLWVLSAVGLVTLVTVAVFGFVVRGINRGLRSTAKQLNAGSTQLAAASTQVASAAQSLAQGATEQAAALEQTSASMEEMGSMARANAENANQAVRLVIDVARQVEASNASLDAMVGSMTAITESSGKVAKIIKTIDEIAFQTNILALNAAVEAARAGEAGMGFAVVADEVRTLAQRSAQAARDTQQLIEESIVRSNDGASRVEHVVGAISAITTSVAEVKGLVEQMREATAQQHQGISQVTQALTQMEQVTQTTAATAEESAAASEELNAQADAAAEIVQRLEGMVERRAA